MYTFKTIPVSLRALGRNKMRSFLTALGIIIGVGAVVAMISIGQGAKIEVEKRFDSMGTNLLFVTPGSSSFRGVSGGSGTMDSLTEDDAKAIEKLNEVTMLCFGEKPKLTFVKENDETME